MYLSLIRLCVVLVAGLANAKSFIKIRLPESKSKRVAFEFAQTHAVVGVNETFRTKFRKKSSSRELQFEGRSSLVSKTNFCI